MTEGTTFRRPRILVRRPSPDLAAGQLTHLTRSPVDAELALEQWHGYVETFRARGWQVSKVEPADDCPDGVFVEDTVVVFGELAVLTSPGTASRRGEVASTERALLDLIAGGLDLRIAGIEEPGTLDGGDVLKIGRTAYVGLGSRTNPEGLRQLTGLLAPEGWSVIGTRVTQVLHLKSGVTALPDGTAVGYAPFADTTHPFPRFLPVPEEHGTAVVDLGGGAVLMSADAPRTAELFTARGLEVVRVPISEFERLEGCVTCLSVRLR